MFKNKSILIFAMVLVLVANLFACGKKSGDEAKKGELIVFAAASMTETLGEIGNNYMKDNPNVKMIFNFDSSGTLKTQIQEGADCDIFISAAPKQMDQLDIEADSAINKERLDYVNHATRFNLLENRVALVVPNDNFKDIKSYEDLIEKLKSGEVVLAMGNSDVPVGQYTEKIFKYFGINEDELAKRGLLTYGTNVKEVTTQVKEGIVDCGIVYESDAISANLKVIDYATKDMCGQVIYPISILKNSKNTDEAIKFLDYLKNDKSKEVFKKVGLTPCF